MLQNLPYNCQVNILLRLDLQDFKHLEETGIWQHSCKSVTVWRHLLNQSTKNCVILDSYIANAIRSARNQKHFTNSTAVKLLEQNIQDHEIKIDEFRNSSDEGRTKSFYEILRDHFLRYIEGLHRNTLIDEELEIDETSIARILLFGPDLSQTWIGIGNRE